MNLGGQENGSCQGIPSTVETDLVRTTLAGPGLSGLGKRWIWPRLIPEASQLAESLGLEPVLGGILWQGGWRDSERARAFLDPKLIALSDPFLLPDLQVAAQLIQRAIGERKRIAIFGDYDVDGITSSALLWRVLRRLGAEPETFLPLRIEEGYGLSPRSIERCVAELRPDLLIAVDCGTTSLKAVEWLTERGIEVIIVDHHALGKELPAAAALINPQRDQKMTYLASVGLVFKLCHGLLKLDDTRRFDLREYLDLVALGTVADIAPLISENRTLVWHGLRRLEQTISPGIRALVEISRLTFPITAQDVGFCLGPRLNASGRMGDASRSLRLLQTDDYREAVSLAAELEVNNRHRQSVELATVKEAQAMVSEEVIHRNREAIILSGKKWHWGVLGIVASRLQKRFHRPTIIIGFDEQGQGKGSGRSIEGFSLVRALHQCEPHLLNFGGHDMAAGLSIEEGKIEAFRLAFNQVLQKAGTEEMFQPLLSIAAILPMSEVGEPLFRQLEAFAPFGRANGEPTFCFRQVSYARPPLPIKEKHIKLFLRAGQGRVIQAIGFGMAHYDWSRPPLLLAGVLAWDDFNDCLQIRITDWSPAK